MDYPLGFGAGKRGLGDTFRVDGGDTGTRGLGDTFRVDGGDTTL